MGNVIPAKKRPFLPVKYDVIFRLFFADERNEEELIGFLKSFLRLPDDEYQSIEIADPHLLPEYIGDKYAVIDVKLYTKSRKIIHIEIQLKISSEMRERIVFYDAKLITEQLGNSDKYGKIEKVISIVIADENMIPDSRKYHHRFTFYDPQAGVEFTDIVEIHTIELKKLPTDTDGTAIYDWAKFINAETEEELNMISQRNPQIGRAAVKLRALSADERARDMLERRIKGWRDHESLIDRMRQESLAEGHAKGHAEGRIGVARNALKKGMLIDDVAEITGMTRKEIEALLELK